MSQQNFLFAWLWWKVKFHHFSKRQIMWKSKKQVLDKRLLEKLALQKWFWRYGYLRNKFGETGIREISLEKRVFEKYLRNKFGETGIWEVNLDKWEFRRSEFGEIFLEKWGTTGRMINILDSIKSPIMGQSGYALQTECIVTHN